MEAIGDEAVRCRMNVVNEVLIEDLYTQIEVYKNGHEALKDELNLLINTNKQLSMKYQELLNTKIPLSTRDEVESEEISCLKDQIEALTREKNCSYELWQNSQKIIDQLENEVRIKKTPPTFPVIDIDKLKELHQQEISDLKKNLDESNKLLETTKQKHEETIQQQKQDLILSLKSRNELLNKIKEHEVENAILKEQLKTSEAISTQLHETVNEQQSLIKRLKDFEVESKTKVNEAVSIAELAIFDKNAGLAREIRANEQIEELKKAMQDLVNEAGEKVKAEVEDAREKFNEKVKALTKDVSNVKNELKERTEELEKERKKCKNLQEDLDRIKLGSIYAISEDEKSTKILDLERKLESTFQKLILSERRVVQLISERDGIKMDLDQMSNNFARSSQEYESQKKEAQTTIKQLKDQISTYNVLLEKYEGSLRKLRSEAEKIENELTDKINTQNKIINEKLPEQIKRMETHNLAERQELQSYIKSEQDLNKKWKREMRDITKNFQKRLKELKNENADLKKHLAAVVEVGKKPKS